MAPTLTTAETSAECCNEGGVADVLENKDTRNSLSHLGALASVWLYWNDRQIKQVSYREYIAASSSYTVTVRAVSDRLCGESTPGRLPVSVLSPAC